MVTLNRRKHSTFPAVFSWKGCVKPWKTKTKNQAGYSLPGLINEHLTLM